jgi:hypothetical protein
MFEAMSTKHGALAFFLCACGASTSSSPPQDLPQITPSTVPTFTIRMSRPLHAGEKLHVVNDAEESRVTTMTQAGSVIDKKKVHTRVHMDAIVTILDIDASFDMLRARYDVSDLSSSGESMKSLLHDQRVEITRAKKDDDAVVLVEGAPATPELRDALKMVLTFRAGGPSDDDIFGSKEPRAVGSHWSIDAQRAHDDLVSDQGQSMANALLDGDVTLAASKTENGVDCLELQSELHMKNIDVPEAPAGSTVLAGNATAKFDGLFPIDLRIPRILDELTMSLDMKLRMPTKNGDVVIQVDGSNKRVRRTTLLN